MSISPGEATAIRRELAVVAYPHTFTRTPITEWLEDPEGNAELQPGTPVPGLPCNYEAEETLVTDTGGRTTIYRPSLDLPHDAALEVGDQVSNITTAEGVVLLAGPLTVERVMPDAAFGPTLNKLAHLSAGDPR
jgi:hypothetical protein